MRATAEGMFFQVRSKSPLNDGQDHKIHFILRAKNATLEVDGNADDFNENLSIGDIMDVENYSLFLGGHENDVADVTDYVFSQGFAGCIKQLGIEHYKLPGKSGPSRYGSRNLPLNSDRFVEYRKNMECVKMCRV